MTPFQPTKKQTLRSYFQVPGDVLDSRTELATWALRDQPEWTRERILNAMEEGPISQRVHLTRPLQVILFYVTAMVRLDDGTVQFADDIYGHDGRLARALAEKVRSEREK